MESTRTYGAEAIAEDLKNLGEEIATDTERTLDETHPREFRHEDWEAMREAIRTMRAKLDEMEEMIDRAASEADGYNEEAEEDRYETYWE